MRGINFKDIATVRLLRETHQEVLSFRQRLTRQSTEKLDQKFNERQEERTRLTEIFEMPIEELLQYETLLTTYLQRFYRPLEPHSCVECRHYGEDQYNLGKHVCWLGWQRGGRPKPLTSLTPCPSYFVYDSPRRGLERFLEGHGIFYSAARWKGHINDLQREAGTWGFHAGNSWEKYVRQWIANQYGHEFFIPHRWIVATTKSGARIFRQVDGIERCGEEAAIVYEIKRWQSAYKQLMEEYIPLLSIAFPHVTFVPLEINSSDPYLEYLKPPCEMTYLKSIDDRDVTKGYQIFILEDGLQP